jgi:hypothetical protein
MLPELRWTRARLPGELPRFDVVTLRDVVGHVQDYQPACAQTARTIATHGTDSSISTCALRSELDRLAASPIVLNRRLREAVERRLAQGELSMSEIAIRCNRVKRDKRGALSGETSWLARRIGQLPEGGAKEPRPWVHTDVLAVIARDGLGLTPSEVEL